MHFLIILSSRDPEIRWNAIRFGNFLLNKDEEVTIFLNGAAVNYLEGDGERFPIREQAKLFSLSEGVLVA
jgi:uncharacterized protein involved in oxidation of intracellular sulfur